MPGDSHNPVQLVAQLRQTLSADKLSLGFFLGAGCPCSVRVQDTNGKSDRALIPDIRGITEKVEKQLAASESSSSSYADLLKTFSDDGFDSPNIEAILNRVRAFRDVAGTKDVRGLTSANLEKLDKEICDQIRQIVTCALPNNSTPYHSLASFVGSHRSPFIEIFTTNYDVLMEQALEERKVAYFDGFLGSRRPFFDQQAIEEDSLPPRWSRFWKLHGSINWYFRKDRKVVFRSESPDEGDEILIHPSHLKYDESRRMPYFVMIDRLRAFLRRGGRPVALFVCGYSFGDEHLNAAIVESLGANSSAACFALQHGKLDRYTEAVRLAKETPGLSVLGSDRAVIRRREAPWIAPAATETSILDGLFDVAVSGEEAQPEVKANADTAASCSLLLGDFKAFGSFLDQFSGYNLGLSEAPGP